MSRSVVRNGYNLLAPVYDVLSMAVFGRSVRKSQAFLLDRIPKHARVMILGGGTGWLLRELIRVRPECQVWYVESSPGMMRQAKRYACTQVRFVLGTILDLKEAGFDVVIMPFFLDQFSEDSLAWMMPLVMTKSTTFPLWLVTDFVDRGKVWQKSLLKIMYTFFHWLCGLETRRLPDWNAAIHLAGMNALEAHRFYKSFILAVAYSSQAVTRGRASAGISSNGFISLQA